MTPTPQFFMTEALKLAEQAASLGEVPVGAVIVRDNQIISSGFNRVEAASDATRHAEIEAISKAGALSGGWRLSDCSLFVTMEPCPMCIGAILLARIKELYFGCYDERLGAVGSQLDLSTYPNMGGKLQVYPEILSEPAAEVVRKFFVSRRK